MDKVGKGQNRCVSFSILGSQCDRSVPSLFLWLDEGRLFHYHRAVSFMLHISLELEFQGALAEIRSCLEVPFWLLLFGSAGQIIFTLRFVYQWVYSVRRHQSFLPVGFWIISLIGSGTIIAYGIFRHDPVLILGQSFGFVAYCRNLVIGFKERKVEPLQQFQ